MLEPILAGDGSLHDRDPLFPLTLRFGLKNVRVSILKHDLNAELAPVLMAWDRGSVPAVSGKVQNRCRFLVFIHPLEGKDMCPGDNCPARPPHPQIFRLFRQVAFLQNVWGVDINSLILTWEEKAHEESRDITSRCLLLIVLLRFLFSLILYLISTRLLVTVVTFNYFPGTK